MANRKYADPVVKKLFALSRNRCAFPSCEELLSKPEWPKVLAKICHICGLNPGSARHDPMMLERDCNDFPNLILLCPNHHDLIDELEPQRWTVEDLCDMKAAHENRRPGDVDWCTDDDAGAFVAKLVKTHGYVVIAGGEQPRKLIRSGDPMPEPDRQPRPIRHETQPWNGREFEPTNSDWPRGKRRVRDLAKELGMTQRTVMELCETLGIPARGKDSTLSEPYADMLRRRARRSTSPAGVR